MLIHWSDMLASVIKHRFTQLLACLSGLQRSADFLGIRLLTHGQASRQLLSIWKSTAQVLLLLFGTTLKGHLSSKIPSRIGWGCHCVWACHTLLPNPALPFSHRYWSLVPSNKLPKHKSISVYFPRVLTTFPRVVKNI